MHYVKIGKVLVAILLAACFVPASAPASSLKEGDLGKGSAAPMFVSEDLEGRKTSLEEIVNSGKSVLLNFWGLRCANCIVEIGYLNAFHEKYKDKGVVFIGVNVDGVGADAIRKSIPKLPAPPVFTILPDSQFTISELFKMTAAPLSFVIGKDGKILYRHEDFQPGDEKGIEEALEMAVRQGK